MSEQRVWMPHVTVAAIVERNGRFLFVEEEVNGDTVINQPAGHWEEGETFAEAAVRECFEETGWKVEVTGLVGVYEYKPHELDYAFVRFAYAAKPIAHDSDHVLDTGIKRWFWMDQNELKREIYRHRSPMVQQCVEDYWTVKRWPLSVVTHQTVRQRADEAHHGGADDGLTLRPV